MKPFPDLLDVLPTLPVRAFVGVLYRAVSYSVLHGVHASNPHVPNPLFAEGPPTAGARFTPRGGMPSLYLASDRSTADLEANQAYLLVQQINPAAVPGPPATVLLTARVQLDAMLDVTEPSVQALLDTTPAELTSPWRTLQPRGQRAPTQDLGAAVHQTRRAQAIWYPSAVSGGRQCIVVFTDLLTPTSFIEIYDPGTVLARRIP